jgi:hypothetical protein
MYTVVFVFGIGKRCVCVCVAWMPDHRPANDWGKFMWGLLHTITVLDCVDNDERAHRCVQQLVALKGAIPCGRCADHYQTWLDKLPARDVTKSMELFRWSVDLHNSVNARIGRPDVPYEDALAMWTYECSPCSPCNPAVLQSCSPTPKD